MADSVEILPRFPCSVQIYHIRIVKNSAVQGAFESLVGRIRFIDVFPLTFKEFVEWSGVSLSEELHARIDDFQELEKAYFSVITERQRLLHLMTLYLEVGGYPEWFKIRDVERW